MLHCRRSRTWRGRPALKDLPPTARGELKDFHARIWKTLLPGIMVVSEGETITAKTKAGWDSTLSGRILEGGPSQSYATVITPRGADHAGFKAREEVEALIQKKGYRVIDLGTASEASTDYPECAARAARAASKGEAERGVRAELVTGDMTAETSRKPNDAEVFCAGARVLPGDRIGTPPEQWRSTPFGVGPRERRFRKINDLDRNR